ncbi:MAG TPA: alpha-L-fucosidase [Puia sp.]|nr:alpha-L-fucosidase [Puia sp.]
MKRRNFIRNMGVAGTMFTLSPALGSILNQPAGFAKPPYSHRLPHTDDHYKTVSGYVEEVPVPEYHWASDKAYEDFKDIKFGVRLHWGLYSILQLSHESWGFLGMTREEKQHYQELYKTWNPEGFDANAWMDFFSDCGFKMFAFTSKHHDGFSMFNTKTTVKERMNWGAPQGPAAEACDFSYSIMNTPFKRDVVKELCEAAHQRGIKIDLYFSHPDWYDTDFRPYNYSPVQVPSAAKIAVTGKKLIPENQDSDFKEKLGDRIFFMPDPTPEEMKRMMQRHRDQLTELLSQYGKIDMVCLDQWLGPEVWPMLRDNMLHLRKVSPDTMFRARGIGNYGDYYTPEGFVPGSKANSDTPWFVIYPLGSSFSYDKNESNYKGTAWVIRNLIDSAAKGGNFMVGIGPEGNGHFHPTAISQLKEVGAWLRLNGEGIYATRARDGDLWKEGEDIRFTRSKDNRTVFAFSNAWPGETLQIKTVKPRDNSKIYFMGHPEPLKWNYDTAGGLTIHLSDEIRSAIPETARHAFGFKISV